MDIPNAASITLAPTSSPFTLQPIIQDLVRTRFAVPGSIFLVEDVQITPLTKTGRWQAIRLLLGDGEFCIQAILRDTMHRFVHTREITVGSYVRARDFRVRLKNVDSDGLSKQMVFLVVYDVKTIGWNDDVCKLYAAQRDGHDAHVPQEYVDKGKSPVRASISATSTPTKPCPAPSSQRRSDREDFGEDDMEAIFDELEALTFPVQKVRKSPSKPSRDSSHKPPAPVALPQFWYDSRIPLKLTTLRALPSLPDPQNWSCNILAIIASLSPVESSALPPYKQRTARITDPSTAKQVHLTVFLDPDEFTPKVGSAVLLTGVKIHGFDGGNLKKYASDRGHGRWWFEDPWDLEWCDVRGIKSWWAKMEAYFASQLSEEVVE